MKQWWSLFAFLKGTGKEGKKSLRYTGEELAASHRSDFNKNRLRCQRKNRHIVVLFGFGEGKDRGSIGISAAAARSYTDKSLSGNRKGSRSKLAKNKMRLGGRNDLSQKKTFEGNKRKKGLVCACRKADTTM